MRGVNRNKKRDLLVSIYAQETFHYTKGEIINQLISDANESSELLIKNAFNDNDPEIQKSIVSYLSNSLLEKYKTEVIRLLEAKSYQVRATALKKIAYQYQEEAFDFVNTVEDAEGIKGKNLLMAKLEVEAIILNSEVAINKLIDLTDAEEKGNTRRNAIEILNKANYLNDELVVQLIEGVIYYDFWLKNKSIEYLDKCMLEDSKKAMINKYLVSKDWTVEEKEMLKAYF